LDAKNFYRALDYQGITFKSNDRKAMAPKALVNEIESLQQDKKLKENDEKAVHTKESFQFRFGFKDAEIFKDVTRVIYSFIDRQTGYTNSDREKIRTFIQTFIPLCFQVEDVVPEGMTQYAEEAEESDLAEEDDDNHSTNTEGSESDVGRSPRKRSQSPSRRRSGRSSRNHHEDEHTMDLLRDVLTKNQNALDEIGQAAASAAEGSRSPSAPLAESSAAMKAEVESSRASSMPALTTENSIISDIENVPQSPAAATEPMEQDQPQQQEQQPAGDKLFAAAAAAIAPDVKKRILYSFFCNTTFYCFFRLYEVKKKKKKKH
jgi:paired amphipathic helix protein Sin3a